MDIPNDTDLFSPYSQTDEHRLLCEAIADNDIALVRELIEFVSNIDDLNDDGDTPLHVAIRSHCIEAIDLLVKRGANLYATNAESDTAWQLACWNGYLDAVKFFVQRDRKQLYTTTYSGNTGLHLAASNGYTEVVAFLVQEDEELLDIYNRHGDIALHLACSNGHLETVKFMVLQDKEQLKKVNLLEDTVLHAAVECIERKAAIQIVHFLIQQGAKLEVKNYCGITPLQQAYRKGRRSIMYCILSFMSDNEMHEMADFLGTKYLEYIVSHFKKEVLYEQHLNSVLGRFQELGIVSNSGLLAPTVANNTVYHYTPSFSYQAQQQQNNTAEACMLNSADNLDSSAENKKRPNSNK